MSYQYNGQELHVAPPVENVSVNNNKVIFTDHNGAKALKLNSSVDTHKFLDWLLNS
ncbi:hypothetical protein [Thalassotalea litorea]|uniref:hypothetical protein n=1 Tax=Thalassotalea litorea TaxID=2020715 RepID=UPI0014852951|nr:hypothetical protein [Thalassotalea litorea]